MAWGFTDFLHQPHHLPEVQTPLYMGVHFSYYKKIIAENNGDSASAAASRSQPTKDLTTQLGLIGDVLIGRTSVRPYGGVDGLVIMIMPMISGRISGVLNHFWATILPQLI